MAAGDVAGRVSACGWWPVTAVAVLLALGLATSAKAQPDAGSWRETFQVEVPLLAEKRLANARGFIEEGEWTAALTLLNQLEEEFPDGLVSLAHGRYINVRRATLLLRLYLPPEGLQVYREQIDGWADQQLDAAAAKRDERLLRQILSTAFASTAGDDVLDRIAEWAWERGDVAVARRRWGQLIPAPATSPNPLLLRYPDTDRELAAVYARLILCSLAESDIDRAAEEIEVFSGMFPQVEGPLAGQTGRLVDILNRQLAEQEQWRRNASEADWSTFAARPTRNVAVGSDVSVGRPVWTMPLKPIYVPRWERPRVALPEQGLLARYPVTLGGGLFLHDGITIHGLRLADGNPLWPLEGVDERVDMPGKFYPPFPAIPNSLPWTPIVGVPRFTSTVHEGRLFALLGPSVLTLPPGGHVASPSRLVCVNLAEGEGQIEWFHTPADLFPEWSVTGTPVAIGDRVYAPLLRSEGQIEQGVACLNARSGALIWLQSVGEALRKPFGGRVELGHQLLTVAGEQVFLATDLGAVAALDAETGRVDWVVTYPAQPPPSVERSDESSVGLMPPVAYEGLLFVKPNDSHELMGIDAATGYVFWRQTTPGKIVQLLGVAGNSLIVSGDQLWAIDIDTGRPRWRFGYNDAAGFGNGRGVIAGRRVIWPTREELFSVDLKSGQVVRRIPLDDSLGVTGGHLILSRDRLIMSGANYLTAFELVKTSGAKETQ